MVVDARLRCAAGAALVLLTLQAPASRPGDDPVAAEARAHALGAEVREAVRGALAGSGRTDLTRVLGSQVRELADLTLELAKESTIQAIRAEEATRSHLEGSARLVAAGEEALRVEAEKCAGLLTASLSSSVPASPDALREAAGHWKAALVSHDVVFEEFCVRRDKALADRTRRKRAAYRAALDVRRQFDEAASEVARADLALRAEARTLQETVSRQLALSLERGRLAQERALAKLDQALTDRVKTFAATRARIEADLFSFVSEDAANVDDASKKRREIVAEMASALAELARRNESAIEAQTGALRELWRRSDPAALARDLDASERGKLLEERLRERDVLLETSRDVARLRDELEALRKRAPLD